MKPKIKPRNPYVVHAKFRKAGVHEKPAKALRRHDKLALCKVVKQLPEHCHKQSAAQIAYANTPDPTDISAAWSAHSPWERDVAGSNPACPTSIIAP